MFSVFIMINMEINKGLIKMIITISFDGRPGGEPYQHLEAFEDICDIKGVLHHEPAPQGM
ncbi:hypothetical protein OSB04_011645 [Centaurea solstitialis]|uniref:Uncharacterized protein n=1 Tax=Centaurea solstitialis TaxID=347529 RepID=A0AA38WQ77_9ASTR|nr:hypothetical protein OSB04_011645 [Centaurea solstitialis]